VFSALSVRHLRTRDRSAIELTELKRKEKFVRSSRLRSAALQLLLTPA
jgi:hypothetical protein